ncbi:MAG: hypothetical protein GY757_16470, partial [bacterium]|nr:hypothetical protein [bacterium]
MDVLLLQPAMLYPRGRIIAHDGHMPPIGLMYLAAPLLSSGYDVKILDLPATPHLDGQWFTRYIESNRPLVVGISGTTPVFNRVLKAAAYVKGIDPGIKVVLGGPHATFTAGEILKKPNVDAVVRGEGDLNFPLLVEHYINGKHSLQCIDGISYREKGSLKENPGNPIEDLDRL